MNQQRGVGARLLAAMLLASIGIVALADRVGYSLVFDCKAVSEDIIAEHHHDWSESTRAARWKMISTDKDVFNSKNTYSFLRVVGRRDSRQKFQVPVPALAHLWISPDSRFIVGVSNIKLWNPAQLVVLNARGTVLLAKSIQASSFPGATESVSNWVTWYKEPSPAISIQATGSSYTLSIEGNNGEKRIFEFRDAP